MLRITPCQRSISDRFPVVSFVVQAPPDRLFEIACATDPKLFRPEERSRRTADNFFTSRGAGLLRAPTGQATYLLPSDQLRRFAGRKRLYFAMGSYGNARGDAAVFSVHPRDADQAPSISISPDFTGKTLDRSRLGGKPTNDRYGAPGPVLSWGGDMTAVEAQRRERAAAYDDGYPSDLWGNKDEEEALDQDAGLQPNNDVAIDVRLEEEEAEQEKALWGDRSADRWGGREFEDAPAMRAAGGRAQRAYGGVHDYYGEPAGFEDAPALHRASFGARDARGERDAPRFGARSNLADLAGHEDAPAARSLGAAPLSAEGAPRAARTSPPRDALPLTIRAKLGIMRPALTFESGDDRYGAVRAGADRGLRFGLAMFPQRSGLLGKVLRAYERRDASGLRAALGAEADEVLEVTNAAAEGDRLAPIAGEPLWSRRWIDKLRALSGVTAFQAAQNEVAIEGIFDPSYALASRLGMATDRALGMVFDRFVDMGEEDGGRFVIEAVSALGRGASEEEMLDALVDASKGLPFEDRVAALRASRDFADVAYQVA